MPGINAALCYRLPAKIDAGECIIIGLLESERFPLLESELFCGALVTLGVSQRILYWHAHIRHAELGYN